MKRAGIFLGLLFILAAPKPVPPGSLELDPASSLTFMGAVAFDAVAPAKAMVDIQCYGSVSGGTDNVGWWDTRPYADAFVLGSPGGVAPPDMPSTIALSWEVFPDLAMDCTARLWTTNKKGLNVLDELTFTV